MDFLVFVLILILGCLVLPTCILAIGFFSTMGVRLKHREVMFDKHEQAKLNAITLEERNINLDAARYRALNEAPPYTFSHVEDSYGKSS